MNHLDELSFFNVNTRAAHATLEYFDDTFMVDSAVPVAGWLYTSSSLACTQMDVRAGLIFRNRPVVSQVYVRISSFISL